MVSGSDQVLMSLFHLFAGVLGITGAQSEEVQDGAVELGGA